MNSRAITWTAATVLLVAISAVLAQPDNRSSGDDVAGNSVAPAGERLPTDLSYLGARSCASTTCHGSVRPDLKNDGRMRRDEYLVWLEEDPHQGAHATLSEPRSLTIFENLGLMQDGSVVEDQSQRFIEVKQKCQACHSTVVQPAGVAARTGRRSVIEGVTCEACHGPAEKWLARHYRTDFAAYTTDEKIALGFNNTNSTGARAQLCTGCHVGSAGREVNHDWIAAGHPAMKFELTSYLAQMPRHWKSSRDRLNASNPESHELELWLAGQKHAAERSLAQLAHRAGNQNGVWPEFTEADCYSCHHDLGPPISWRQDRGFGSQPRSQAIGRVTMPVNEWYLFMLAELASRDGAGEAASQFADNYRQLRNSMESSIVPAADDIARLAAATGLALRQWSAAEDIGAPQLLELVRQAPEGRLVSNWDRAVQAYLMLRVMEGEQAGPEAKRIRRLLAFPSDRQRRFDSPRKFVGVLQSQDSEVTIREEIGEQLLQLEQAIRAARDN